MSVLERELFICYVVMCLGICRRNSLFVYDQIFMFVCSLQAETNLRIS